MSQLSSMRLRVAAISSLEIVGEVVEDLLVVHHPLEQHRQFRRPFFGVGAEAVQRPKRMFGALLDRRMLWAVIRSSIAFMASSTVRNHVAPGMTLMMPPSVTT
jgi:hypothetical protein